MLGAYQVARDGDLTNRRQGVPAVDGAMDLVHGAKRVVVVTDRVPKDGEPKRVEARSFPLTGVARVTRVYTSPAVVDIEDGAFVLREKIPTIPLDQPRRVGVGQGIAIALEAV